ncbi:hypothetical protein Q8A73_009388 [Channa argus]|nr:hypothetical protein Q8A73_009388 [Channa argus]
MTQQSGADDAAAAASSHLLSAASHQPVLHFQSTLIFVAHKQQLSLQITNAAELSANRVTDGSAAAAVALRHAVPSRLRRWRNVQTAGEGGGGGGEGFTDISTGAHHSTEQAACLPDRPRHPFILTGRHGCLGSLRGVRTVPKRTGSRTEASAEEKRQ